MKPESDKKPSRLREFLNTIFILSQESIPISPNSRFPVPLNIERFAREKLHLRKERPLYPCGYRYCANTTITTVKEDDNWITVHCSAHNSNTLWRKPKQV